MAPTVQISHVSFTYPGIDGRPPLIEDVCFSLNAGQRCLLLGSNGAGKTSILKILGGKHVVDPSMVWVLGRSAFHNMVLTSSSDLCYLGGQWRRDVAFAGYQMNIQMGISASKTIFGVAGVDLQEERRAYQVVKAPPLKNASTAKSGVPELDKSRKFKSFVTFCHPDTPRNERSPKQFRISAQHTPRLDPYQVVKYPLFTEATIDNTDKMNMLVFLVDVRADKTEINAVVQEMLASRLRKSTF